MHQKNLSLGDTLPWHDTMDLFERLGGRVAGYEGYSRQVREAFGINDLVLEVEGAAATLATIYIVALHYKDLMEHEAASLELRLTGYSQISIIMKLLEIHEAFYSVEEVMAAALIDLARFSYQELSGA